MHTIIKLLSNIKPVGECWEWQRGRGGNGYGMLWDGKKMIRAHRLAYAVAFGPIPGDLFVLHKCDNKICCNPAHLELGTHQDNMRHVRERGQCKGNHGHPGWKMRRDKLYRPRV